jgi:bifunctional non-homologous end joining protein LigD
MMAVSAATLPAGAEWSYEVKWDGYRAQAVKHGPAVVLASRNLKDITRQFPEVVRAANAVRNLGLIGFVTSRPRDARS